MVRILLVSAIALGAFACKSKGAAPDPASFQCESDADCRVSCVPRDGCCEACECSIAYHRDELVKAREAYQARCEDFCQRSCPAPTVDHVPICNEGRCASKEVPLKSN